MCDLTITIDRVLSFLTTRRHLLFFYSYPQGYPTEPIETMLQRHGNDMVCELEMFVQDCQERGIPFPADVPPYFIQGPTALGTLIYDAPAFPHVLCFASVCRSWFQSIKRAVLNQFYVNTRRLLRVAQLRYDTVEWFISSFQLRQEGQHLPYTQQITCLKSLSPLQFVRTAPDCDQ